MPWPTARGAANRGAATEPLAAGPPEVIARYPTGAQVGQVVEFELAGAPAALVLAGSCLQARLWDGTDLFVDGTGVTTRILHVLETPAGPAALVQSRKRIVRLLDLRTGIEGWRFEAPPGTDPGGAGSAKLLQQGDHALWVVAPAYAETISCFAITGPATVRPRWVRDFGGRYDRGFGPSMVITDALGTGGPQLYLSSRTGADYSIRDNEPGGAAGAEVPTEQIVLGRSDGHLYQAVLDLNSGETIAEVAYRPDPGDYPCARPYGLLRVVGTSGARVAVLVSCQVEEYYSATAIADGQLRRAWGEFVEKDWPRDDQELRPQVTSIAGAATDAPVLVTGHFDRAGWRTVLRGVADGRRIAEVAGCYFWGLVDAAGVELAVLSPAGARQLSGTEPLRAVPVADLGQVAGEIAMRPLTCSTDLLRADVSFHADRRSFVPLRHADGRAGLLVTDGRTVSWWDPRTSAPVPIVEAEVTAAYPGRDAAVLATRGGELLRVAADLQVVASWTPRGQRPTALVGGRDGEVWLAMPLADGTSSLRTRSGAWTIAGKVQALQDVGGELLVALLAGPRTVAMHRCGHDGPQQVAQVDVPAAVCGVHLLAEPPLLVVSERTGVHAAAIGCYRLDGCRVWRDELHGPHPNLSLCATGSSGRAYVAYDDHGVLSLRDAATGELVGEVDWTAAYTTPALVSVASEDMLLRLGGVHGVEALDLQLNRRWRHTAELWRYFPGEAAVAERADGLVLGCASTDGVLDLLDAATGQLRATVVLGDVAQRPPLVAVQCARGADLDFVAGTATGRLIAVDAGSGATRDLGVDLGAAVEYLAAADVSGTGRADLVAGTADGTVHIVRGGGSAT